MNGEDGLERIAAGHAELERLASERVALAKRVVALVTRTRTRLEGDLVRIGVLQGEVDVKVATGAATPTMATMAAAAGTTTTATTLTAIATTTPPPEMYVLHGRNPAVAISESLRHALSGGDGPSPKSEYGGDGHRPCADDDGTERRVQTSIKLPSTTGTGYARSRLSRQIHPVRSALEEEGDADAEGEEEDAEGEEVEEGDGEEGDDQQIYCFCQKLSYGEVSGVLCECVLAC